MCAGKFSQRYKLNSCTQYSVTNKLFFVDGIDSIGKYNDGRARQANVYEISTLHIENGDSLMNIHMHLRSIGINRRQI